MFDYKNKLEDNKIFITIISLFSLFRIYLGMNMPIWLFPKSVHDDVMMFEHSHLANYFANWNIYSLSKDSAYSLFLFFVRLSHISYKFWLSLLWIIAAILVIYAIYHYLTENKTILLCSFLFVLFLPVGFDVLCGQRVYRNAIIAPTTIIFLSMLYIFINKLMDSSINIKNTIIWGVLLGFTFTFTYYIKEDGILTLPILIVCILTVLILKAYDETKFSFSKQNLKKCVKVSVICIIPLLIFIAGTFTYQEVNNHYFGVSEINTRTSGEMGEFYANLLKIEDPNKTTNIWIPASTVEKAVNASPTLQANPKFVNTWLNTHWGQGILINSTIPGDIPGWSLRLALENAGMYKNEKSASDFFSKVNDELDSAFDNGKLQKSDDIFITSSANGKNMGEILALTPYVLFGIDTTFFYQNLEFNNVSNSVSSLLISDNVTKNISQDVHDNFITQAELDNLSNIESIPIKLIGYDIGIYQIIAYALVFISFVGLLVMFKKQFENKFKNRNINILLLFCIMLIGTTLVQIFAISWFCSFLSIGPWVGSIDNITGHVKFYLVSAYGFFTVFVVFTIVGGYSIINDYKLDNLKSKTNNSRPINTKPLESKRPVEYNTLPKEQTSERQAQGTIDIDSIDPELIEEMIKELRLEEKK